MNNLFFFKSVFYCTCRLKNERRESKKKMCLEIVVIPQMDSLIVIFVLNYGPDLYLYYMVVVVESCEWCLIIKLKDITKHKKTHPNATTLLSIKCNNSKNLKKNKKMFTKYYNDWQKCIVVTHNTFSMFQIQIKHQTKFLTSLKT